jgi:large repetitive protein
VRSDFVKGRGVFRAIVVAAILVLLVGCIRPQGAKGLQTIEPSPSPVAVHAPLTIANPVFHSGEVGVTYTPVTLSATGGLPPYTWTVVGALPVGLTLSSDGIVSGTPTQNGFFAFSVQVLDFGNNDTAGVPATIPIVPRLTASLVSGCATECTVELGCVTVCGNFGQVSGGAAPLTYTLTSGPLPAGTTLNGLSLNGTFKGLPGRLQFTVQVTDGFGATALITARYNLLPHISLSGGTCSQIGFQCTVQLAYSGGTPGISPAVGIASWTPTCVPNPTGGPPYCPAQPTFSANASGGAVSITLTSPNGTRGTYVLILTDQNVCGTGTRCSSAGANLTVYLAGG